MTSNSSRLPYLDWVRGIAAVVMLQGHVFHSFLRSDLREGGPYLVSQFVGGMPPAIFLFLLGITFGFLLDSQERKGLPGLLRIRHALKRSGFLFAVAFLFRFQLWAFSLGISPVSDLLRVDVLNCMGFSVAILSVMALLTTRQRARYCAVAGVLIAAASPVWTALGNDWAPLLVRQYLVPDKIAFGFFPWAAFVAFGMSTGSILRLTDTPQTGTAMQWIGYTGLALAFSAYTISNMSLTIYSSSDFWLNSPALVLIKLGAILMLLAFAYLWTLGTQNSWSWIRQMGKTSLIVYWVHIELVYGKLFGYWKERLTVPLVVMSSLILIALMLGLSMLQTAWQTRRNASAR